MEHALHGHSRTPDAPTPPRPKASATEGAAERPAGQLEGMTLPGRRTGQTWSVLSRYTRPSGFSVGYLVQNAKGTKAFLKATDLEISRSKDGEPPSDRLRRALKLHIYEREILTICRGNGMGHVVSCLDEGELEVDRDGAQGLVLYLVFELAKGDARASILAGEGGVSRSASALHDLALGIRELHAAKIAHNDIKPANLLIFSGGRYKLADLGRATSDNLAGPYDFTPCAGDRRFAAPELLYASTVRPRTRPSSEERTAADLYALGSIAYYFLVRRMLTPCLLEALRARHANAAPDRWRGDFAEVAPRWRHAFRTCMSAAEQAAGRWPLGEPERLALLGAIRELCEPDPLRRARAATCAVLPRYSLDHYIALFDTIRQATAAARGATPAT